MKETENIKPPRLMLAFFRWYCSPELREEIEGDLLERFHKYSTIHSVKKANWLFIKDVLFLLRPGIINIRIHFQKNIPDMSKKNWIILMALNLACVLMIISPFIPGPSNDLVRLFSMTGNIVGFTAVLLVPVGLMWTVAELIKWERKGMQANNKPILYHLAIGTSVFMAAAFLAGVLIFPSAMKIFAFIDLLLVIAGLGLAIKTIKNWKLPSDIFMNIAPSLVFATLATSCIAVVGIICSLALFLGQGAIAGILSLLAFSVAIFCGIKQVIKTREKVETKFNRVPVYLVSIPLTAFLVAMFMVNPVSDLSRNHAIKKGEALINAIENYYKEKGNYPESIENLTDAPKHTSIMGTGDFKYERNRKAYNLSFIQWLHFGATQEVVMYNKNNEHNVKGHFASHNASIPYWKYYWLD